MKVIIYEAAGNTPFEDIYKLIGGIFNKIFFSNIENFEESKIGVLLPNEGDDSVFFVPENWDIDFNKLLRNKLGEINWQSDSSHRKPPKEEIVNNWDEKLAEFYEKEVEIISVRTSIGQCPRESELDNIDKGVTEKILPHLSFFIAIIILVLFFITFNNLSSQKELREKQVHSIIKISLYRANKENKDSERVAELCQFANSVSQEEVTNLDDEKVCEKVIKNVSNVDNKSPTIPSINLEQPKTVIPIKEPIKQALTIENKGNDNIKSDIMNLVDKANEAIKTYNLISLEGEEKGIELKTQKMINGEVKESASAFWYAKKIFTMSTSDELDSLRIEKVGDILLRIIEEYFSMKQKHCPNIRSVYGFIEKYKKELQITKNQIDEKYHITDEGCSKILPSMSTSQ